jgi:hypothetical protein
MNAKPEQIQTGSSADVAEKNNGIAPAASPTELTEVTNDELGQVEGGSAPLHQFKYIPDPGSNGIIGGRSSF